MTLWKVAIVFRDRDGNERQTSLHTSSAATVAELVSFAQGMESAIAPLSNAAIVRGAITQTWLRTPGEAVAASNVQRKALLLTRETDDSRYASVLIPSPRTGAVGTRDALPLGQWMVANPLGTGTSARDRATRGTHTPRIMALRGANGLLYGVSASSAAQINALLAVIVRQDGSPFPTADWLYAELSP